MPTGSHSLSLHTRTPTVALQFPEGLLMFACTISDILEKYVRPRRSELNARRAVSAAVQPIYSHLPILPSPFPSPQGLQMSRQSSWVTSHTGPAVWMTTRCVCARPPPSVCPHLERHPHQPRSLFSAPRRGRWGLTFSYTMGTAASCPSPRHPSTCSTSLWIFRLTCNTSARRCGMPGHPCCGRPAAGALAALTPARLQLQF